MIISLVLSAALVHLLMISQTEYCLSASALSCYTRSYFCSVFAAVQNALIDLFQF